MTSIQSGTNRENCWGKSELYLVYNVCMEIGPVPDDARQGLCFQEETGDERGGPETNGRSDPKTLGRIQGGEGCASEDREASGKREASIENGRRDGTTSRGTGRDHNSHRR